MSDRLCPGCAMQAALEEQRLRLWASQGLTEMGRYLARWAAFEHVYGPN